MKRYIKSFARHLEKIPESYIIAVTAAIGILSITISTLFAFLTRELHGDMVAQQVMVEQWTHGIAPLLAHTEATNYIVKFPLYWLMNGLVADPLARLVLTALFLNITAWLLLWYFVRKIATATTVVTKLHDIFIGLLAILMAVLAPYLLWINYPNSRNVELGFMLAIVYILLRLQQGWRLPLKWIATLGVCAGIVYVNDPLSFYLVAVPFACSVIAVIIIHREKFITVANRATALFLATSVVSYVILKTFFLGILITVPDKVSGATLPHGVGIEYSLVNIVSGLAYNMGILPTLKFGPTKSGPMLTILAIATTLVFVAILLLGRSKKDRGLRRTQGLLAITGVLAVAVVFFSGYLAPAVDILFARYVATVSVIVLVLVAVGYGVIKKDYQVYGLIAASVFVMFTGLLLTRVQIPGVARLPHAQQYWQSVNQREYALIAISKKYDIHKGYSSIQTAQPTTYISGGELTMIPVMCDKSDRELPVQRAYDWLIEARSAFVPTGYSMIEVAKQASDFNPCSKDVVVRQIGRTPKEIIDTDSSHVAIVYEADIRPELKGLPLSQYKK